MKIGIVGGTGNISQAIVRLFLEMDRRWVIDQVMASEAPDAVALVQRAMRELHTSGSRRARRERMSRE